MFNPLLDNSMNPQTHFYSVMVKELHLDSYGHMNNAVYLELFEDARWDLITNNGYGFEKIHATKLGPTILAVEIQFKKELRLRQQVVIETQLQSYEKKIGKILQVMKNEAGEVCCDALFTFGLFDMVQRKLVPPTEDWKRALGLNL